MGRSWMPLLAIKVDLRSLKRSKSRRKSIGTRWTCSPRFLDESCVKGSQDYTARGTDLHSAYLQSIDNDKEAHLTQRQFYRRLREHGFTSYVGHGNATYWRGVGLQTNPKADPGGGPSNG